MRIVKSILVGLAIFTVSTMSYGLIRGTIEYYRIAHADFHVLSPRDFHHHSPTPRAFLLSF